MKSSSKGMAMIAICALMWSIGGLFIKVLNWHPTIIIGARSIIAATVIYIIFFYNHRLVFPIVNSKTIMQGISLSATCSLFVFANKLTTAANAIVLQSASPIFVLIACAVIKKQKFTKKDILVVSTVFVGVALFFLDDVSVGGTLGNILALCSAITIGSAFIFTSEAKSPESSISGVLLGHLFNAILSIPFIFIYPPTLDVQSVQAIFILGVFQLGIPYALFAYGGRMASPLSISLLTLLEPIFNPVWVAIFVREIPGPLALFGGVIVIATLVYWCLSNNKKSVVA